LTIDGFFKRAMIMLATPQISLIVHLFEIHLPVQFEATVV
jgi:hypothetical protein